MEKIYVFGHRNPDTDSVGASIALAHLKKELKVNAIPVILSNINNETRFALNYFGIKKPMFLNDVKLKIKDTKYHKGYYIKDNMSLLHAYNDMIKENISNIPVVLDDLSFVGILAMKDITRYLIENDTSILNTTYENILDAINGEVIYKFDDMISGEIIVASDKSTTFIENATLSSDNILIVGDRHSIIEYAINSNVKLLVLSSDAKIKKEHLRLAKKNKINIIKTKYSTLNASQRIELANEICSTYFNKDVVSVRENETLDSFMNLSSKLKYSYYPVVNDNNKCLGMISLANTNDKTLKKVILVDHNDYKQSIEGIEEAQILEVIDHHNIGNIGTNAPINFRNSTVGSTNTIIYQMYNECGVSVPRDIAGIMASGIISDTLLLKSPTTTKMDKEALVKLSKIAKIDYEKFGIELLKEGASTIGRTKEEILYQDFKKYPVKDSKIGIGQVATTDASNFLKEKDEYQRLINNIAINNDYIVLALFVNDIMKNGSYVFYNDKAKHIIEDAFNVKDIYQGYFLKGIISRKLQMIPRILEECQNEE